MFWFGFDFSLQAMVNQGDIVECATIGLKDSLKGHVPVGLCVLRSGMQSLHMKLEETEINEVSYG